jgi:hypothetical protein
MSCIGSPVFSHLNCLFCGITGNCLDGGVTDLKSQSIFDRPAAQDPSKACFGSKFSKNSLFLRWRPVSQDCFRHQAFQRLSLKQKWNGRAGFAARFAVFDPNSFPIASVCRRGCGDETCAYIHPKPYSASD